MKFVPVSIDTMDVRECRLNHYCFDQAESCQHHWREALGCLPLASYCHYEEMLRDADRRSSPFLPPPYPDNPWPEKNACYRTCSSQEWIPRPIYEAPARSGGIGTC